MIFCEKVDFRFYNERPKMKRDTRDPGSGKRLLFSRVSLFIFGHSSYLRALVKKVDTATLLSSSRRHLWEFRSFLDGKAFQSCFDSSTLIGTFFNKSNFSAILTCVISRFD